MDGNMVARAITARLSVSDPQAIEDWVNAGYPGRVLLFTAEPDGLRSAMSLNVGPGRAEGEPTEAPWVDGYADNLRDVNARLTRLWDAAIIRRRLQVAIAALPDVEPLCATCGEPRYGAHNTTREECEANLGRPCEFPNEHHPFTAQGAPPAEQAIRMALSHCARMEREATR